MPLTPTTLAPAALALALGKQAQATTRPAFAVVYASHVNGASWCFDCRRAEPVVERKFAGAADEVPVVFAGDVAGWRDLGNVWRKEPWGVTHLPTVVKVTAEGKWEKLVEADVYDQKKLDAFVGF